MTLKAFGYSLATEDREVIGRMCEYLGEKNPKIVDLRSFDPETSSSDIVLVYGEQANKKLNGAQCKARLVLPEVSKLRTKLGSTPERLEAKQKLEKFKATLDGSTEEVLDQEEAVEETKTKTLELNEQLPAELTATKVKELERQLLKEEVDHWSGCTVDGKSIRVTVEPELSTADINLTFAELYAVMSLKEAFRVKELEIVYKPSVFNRKTSSS